MKLQAGGQMKKVITNKFDGVVFVEDVNRDNIYILKTSFSPPARQLCSHDNNDHRYIDHKPDQEISLTSSQRIDLRLSAAVVGCHAFLGLSLYPSRGFFGKGTTQSLIFK